MANTALEGTVYKTSFLSSCNIKIYVHKATSEHQHRTPMGTEERRGAAYTSREVSCCPSPKAATSSCTINCRVTELSPTSPRSDLNP